jgi:hypothetical protein
MLNSIFSARKLNKFGIQVVAEVRDNFDSLLNTLENRLPPSRELSIVKTNLETACMYTIKAVSLDPMFQDYND